LLASAYRKSLQVASEQHLRSVSFPSISTGAFCYPIRLAAPVALKTIIEFLESEQHSFSEIRMVLYTREDEKAHATFVQALMELLEERVTGKVTGNQ